jgi:hypothetical protein
MNPLDTLTACAGNWLGTSTLQDTHAGSAETAPSAVTVTPGPDGQVRLEYTWAYQGRPQHGSLLLRRDGATVTATWMDSWHTGGQPMACAGPLGPALSVRGSYAAPPGPDWGWRIDLVIDCDTLRLVMFNVWPVEQGGKEELAVEAVYTRGEERSFGVGDVARELSPTMPEVDDAR